MRLKTTVPNNGVIDDQWASTSKPTLQERDEINSTLPVSRDMEETGNLGTTSNVYDQFGELVNPHPRP
jgi:hypothetical protein